jgi:hypothetical protein
VNRQPAVSWSGRVVRLVRLATAGYDKGYAKVKMAAPANRPCSPSPSSFPSTHFSFVWSAGIWLFHISAIFPCQRYNPTSDALYHSPGFGAVHVPYLSVSYSSLRAMHITGVSPASRTAVAQQPEWLRATVPWQAFHGSPAACSCTCCGQNATGTRPRLDTVTAKAQPQRQERLTRGVHVGRQSTLQPSNITGIQTAPHVVVVRGNTCI